MEAGVVWGQSISNEPRNAWTACQPQTPSFYQSQSTDLLVFSEPEVIIASSRGSTGGSDPAMLELDDGGDVFLLGPLDLTTMAWYRAADGLGIHWQSQMPILVKHLPRQMP